MAKRYPARHLTIFAVYRKFTLYGELCRYFKIALPSMLEADQWILKFSHDYGVPKNELMIEEMPAIMKAWRP